MITNETGIVEASEQEVFIEWLMDPDIQEIMPFAEFVIRLRQQGVKIS